jgi:hypothetical protein
MCLAYELFMQLLCEFYAVYDRTESVGVFVMNESPLLVNEFYKKGCQEKSSALAGASEFLAIQPTIVSRRWGSSAFYPFS